MDTRLRWAGVHNKNFTPPTETVLAWSCSTLQGVVSTTDDDCEQQIPSVALCLKQLLWSDAKQEAVLILHIFLKLEYNLRKIRMRQQNQRCRLANGIP